MKNIHASTEPLNSGKGTMGQNLPSMQTLLAFEAAARHLNFTKAAQELNLTQTAISHQIRNLERQLGVKLFVRQRNTLSLTSAAREYLDSVSAAINLVASATETTKRDKPHSSLSIVCLPTYATQCLIPALPEFQRLYPNITVHLLTSSTFSEFGRASYDIAIRYGSGKWGGSHSELLHNEEFFPVCASSLLPRDPTLSERQLLTCLPQIRTYYYSLYQDDWPAWLMAAGLSGVKFRSMSVFHMQLASLEAAVAGSGWAIGRTPLVDRYLASGAIVAPFGTRVRSESAYFLTSPSGKANLKKVQLFRQWALQRLGQQGKQPSVMADALGRQGTDITKKNDHGYRPVSDLLAEWRSRSPDKYALIDVTQDRRITFYELADFVETAAHQLRAKGVAPADRVVVYMKDSLEKIVLWLALWRLAAVVCPIDLSRFRVATVQRVCDTLDPPWIACGVESEITQVPPKMLDRILRVGMVEPSAEPTVACDIDFAEPSPENGALPSGANGDDIAAICATSGTTGEPKLVVWDHTAYWINGKNIVERLALTANDRLLEYRSFDWSSAQILSLMAFLQTGLTLHVAPRFSRSSFAAWVGRFQLTVSVGVPAVINLLLQKPENISVTDLSSLRYMTCSTSFLPTAQWLRFEQIFRVRLLNIYGSSEAGWMCSNRNDDIQVGTVGFPMPGVSMDIVDDSGRTCAIDAIGQIMVQGPALALGLLKPDGGLEQIRGKRLATKDLGVMDSAGMVRITGRVDDLIIRGGVKIYPADIEEVILAHPEVLDAAVVGVSDDIYGQSPVCFFVPRSDFSARELQAYCNRNLPHEAIPKSLVQLKRLPRSVRGKLMRADLLKYWQTDVAPSMRR